MSNPFSAKPSALGYLYQVRYSLFLLLSRPESEMQLYVEALDDVDLRLNAQPIELIQLKHGALKKQATLTDSSEEFWKSIRIWSEQVRNNNLSSTTLLTLVTTATVPDSSILSYFKPGREIDIIRLHHELITIATKSKAKTLTSAFDAFKTLSESQRLRLIEAIRILDASADISDTREKLKAWITAPTRMKDPILDNIEGWWFNTVIDHLNTTKPQPITRFTLDQNIWQIQRQYDEDNLPTNFWEEIRIPLEDETNEMIFVRQLKAIALDKPMINKAIRDYFYAFAQRSRWQREQLLFPNELEEYEEKLVDEWERARYWESEYDDHDEKSMVNVGRKLYRRIDEAKESPRIRPKVEEPYIVRGSYHILADKPRVWWHPMFLERLVNLVVASDSESKWQRRPVEVANLLNPAFCSILLRNAIKNYQVERNGKMQGMPYSLLFLILPIVLHKGIREILPRKSTTKMIAWLQENPHVLIGFPTRSSNLKEITREALYFGLDKGVIQPVDITATTYLATNTPFRKSGELNRIMARLDTSEVDEIQRKSSMIGRWFLRVGSDAAIYSAWGIMP